MEKELGSRGEKQIPRGTEHIVKHRVPVMEGAVHWSSPFIVSGQFADHLNQTHLHGGLAGEPEGGQKGDGEAFQGSALTRWWSFINLFTITPQCHSSLLSFSPKLRLISDFTCQNCPSFKFQINTISFFIFLWLSSLLTSHPWLKRE